MPACRLIPQAYARELLLQQHLLGAPQPPPPPPAFPGQGGANGFLQHGGAGGAHHMPQPPPQPQQQQGLGALRNGGGYLHPFGRAGPRTLPGKVRARAHASLVRSSNF